MCLFTCCIIFSQFKKVTWGKENHVFRTGNFYKLLAFSSMNENVLM